MRSSVARSIRRPDGAVVAVGALVVLVVAVTVTGHVAALQGALGSVAANVAAMVAICAVWSGIPALRRWCARTA